MMFIYVPGVGPGLLFRRAGRSCLFVPSLAVGRQRGTYSVDEDDAPTLNDWGMSLGDALVAMAQSDSFKQGKLSS
jgi:hypothetical protein